jgi:transcription initiation factor IIE alpha subunit
MKTFEVVNDKDCKDNTWGEDDCRKVLVTLMEGPYTDERILNKTGYNPNYVRIKDVTQLGDE